MILSVSITDSISPKVAGLVRALRGRKRLSGFIGRALQAEVKRHVLGLSDTRHATARGLGAQPTGFLEDAAKAVGQSSALETDGTGGALVLPRIHFARAFGDVTILPRSGKFLTIPARTEAYGKRARSFKNLSFVPTGRGRGLLVVNEASLVKWGAKKGAKGEKRVKGAKASREGGRVGGGVMYFLVPKVLQRQDRSLLPGEGAMRAAMLEGAADGLRELEEEASR